MVWNQYENRRDSVGTESDFIYAKRICSYVSSVYEISLVLQPIVEEYGDYYSKISKSGIKKGDGTRIISAATIYINFKRLNTKERVRYGLAHEFAHLAPGANMSFRERWAEWLKTLREIDIETS